MDSSKLLYFILLIFLFIFVYKLLGKKKTKKSAKKILDLQKALYSTRHEFQEINPMTFPNLDLKFYDDIKNNLAAIGFKFLADIEDVTCTKAMPSVRTFIRTMIDNSGTIMGSIYHFKTKGIMKLLLIIVGMPAQSKVIDFETEFSDGSFICTSNTLETDKTGNVPGIKRVQFPNNTSYNELLAAHKSAVARALSSNSNIKLVVVKSLSEVLDSQYRMQEKKNTYKQSIGYMNKEELAKISDGKFDDELIENVSEEIDKLKQGKEN